MSDKVKKIVFITIVVLLIISFVVLLATGY